MGYGALLSNKLVGEGKYDEAVEVATREIALQPDEPEAYFHRGQARVALGQLVDAVADYEHALTLDFSGSSLDPEVVDDELFFALRTLAASEKEDPTAAIATITRYATMLPEGRHIEDIAKWVDSFNGVETVWYRDRA